VEGGFRSDTDNDFGPPGSASRQLTVDTQLPAVEEAPFASSPSAASATPHGGGGGSAGDTFAAASPRAAGRNARGGGGDLESQSPGSASDTESGSASDGGNTSEALLAGDLVEALSTPPGGTPAYDPLAVSRTASPKPEATPAAGSPGGAHSPRTRSPAAAAAAWPLRRPRRSDEVRSAFPQAAVHHAMRGAAAPWRQPGDTPPRDAVHTGRSHATDAATSDPDAAIASTDTARSHATDVGAETSGGGEEAAGGQDGVAGGQAAYDAFERAQAAARIVTLREREKGRRLPTGSYVMGEDVAFVRGSPRA
jgi:hypothetical protein